MEFDKVIIVIDGEEFKYNKERNLISISDKSFSTDGKLFISEKSIIDNEKTINLSNKKEKNK